MAQHNLQNIINAKKKTIKKLNKQLILTKEEENKQKIVELKQFHQTILSEFEEHLHSKKTKKNTLSMCKKSYCNPHCENTLLQNGKTISNKTLQKLKKDIQSHFPNKIKLTDDDLRKEFMNDKNRIFGEKESVLKDDFYENIPPSDVKKMKQKGAISGCVSTIPI